MDGRPDPGRRSPRRRRCTTCGGSGAKPGDGARWSARAAAAAASTRRARASSRSASPARSAAGQGEIIEDPCPTCGGSGLTAQRKRYRVNVPAGVRDGTRIRLAGKGEDGPLGGPPGDLFVTTRVAPSPVFKQRPDGNLEVDRADHGRRGDPGRDRRGPDPARDQADPHPGRHPARHGPAAARRGPAAARPARAAATSATGSRSRSRRDLSDEQKRALEELAEALNDHDPRERLLRERAPRRRRSVRRVREG